LTVAFRPYIEREVMRISNAYYHSKLGVRFYDLFSGDAGCSGPVKGDVDFFVACARQFGAPVLELATGTGRVLWPVAAAGFDIVGLDISHEMLAVARSNGGRQSSVTRERVRFCRMDMASFFLTESFRLAIIPFRAFQHLTLPQEQRSALNCIRQSLMTGGHLVIDLLDPRLENCVPGAPSPMPERRVRNQNTGRTAVRRVVERINDPVRQVFTEKFRLEELDEEGWTLESEETEWTLRWSTRQEMRYLFELTGFNVIAEYSDFFRSPPTYGVEQLWVLQKV
jgi:SAM-dependent methyltransferase